MPYPPGLDLDEEYGNEPLVPVCSGVECQVDWASPDEDDEGIGGEGPQALAAETQAEAKSQNKVLPPLVEAEPPRGLSMRRRA